LGGEFYDKIGENQVILIVRFMKRPKKSEYAEFYQGYIDAAPKGSLTSIHRKSFKECTDSFLAISEEKADFAYATGKWSIKQMLMHIIDTERVFSYRILVFMRGERASIPGFIQEQYAENADVSKRTIKDMIAEWKAVQANTLFLLKQCTEEQAALVGKASNWPITPRALFYIIVGHRLHHLTVLRQKYLPSI
jgi:uncharacterized damage-inducible protein DinB